MATSRRGATLAPGTTLPDYSSQERIKRAFNDDMAAIRREYSRQRSIIRKRVERLEVAGEIYNPYYKKYSNLKEVLPSARSLSDQELMQAMARSAYGIGAGMQSTVSEVRAARKEQIEGLKAEAKYYGDDDLAEELEKGVTPKQLEQANKIMGMVQKVVGRVDDSDTLRQAAIRVVLSGDRKESLLTKAAHVINDLGLGADSQDALADLKQIYTMRGTVRVSYKRSHGRR